jgi:hypothetical protein
MTGGRMLGQFAGGEGRYGFGLFGRNEETKNGGGVRRRAIAITRILQSQAKPCM